MLIKLQLCYCRKFIYIKVYYIAYGLSELTPKNSCYWNTFAFKNTCLPDIYTVAQHNCFLLLVLFVIKPTNQTVYPADTRMDITDLIKCRCNKHS